jgi:hypothetical protein
MTEYAFGSVRIPSINVDDVPRRVHLAVKANPAATISATLSHRAILRTYQKATMRPDCIRVCAHSANEGSGTED